MKQGPKYRITARIISHITDCQRRSAIQRAGVFLAVIWSSFGPVTAGFDSPPLQQRISFLLLFGLIPAATIYVAGYMLSQLIMFKGQVNVITAAACFQYITFCVNYFVNRAVLSTPKVWNKLVRVAQNVCGSVSHFCWRTQALFVEIACLLIRSTARLIIKLQGSEESRRGSDELTQSRHNQFAPPFSAIGTPAYGNGGIGLDSGQASPLGRPEQNDLLESRSSFHLRRRFLSGTAMFAGLGVCACAYFLLASSNKTVPQTAGLSAAVQTVPASAIDTTLNSSEFFAEISRSESLSSRTPARPAEPVDAQLVASAAFPTGSLRTGLARSEDILLVQPPRVNIRSSPSPNGSVLAIALKGTRLKVRSRQADWVQVQNGPLRGWVKAQLLAPAERR
jgi:Bacterial SH3 domain